MLEGDHFEMIIYIIFFQLIIITMLILLCLLFLCQTCQRCQGYLQSGRLCCTHSLRGRMG